MTSGNGRTPGSNEVEMILVVKDNNRYVLTIIDGKIGVFTPNSGFDYENLISKLGEKDKKRVKEFDFIDFKNYAKTHPILGLLKDWERFFQETRPSLDST